MVKIRGLLVNPLRLIEITLALTSSFIAMFILSPFFVATEGGLVDALRGDDITAVALGIAIILGLTGLFNLLGNYFDNAIIRKWTMFTVGLCFLFVVVLRLLNFGIFPIFWLFQLPLVIISFICYLYVDNEYEQKIQRLDKAIKRL